MEFKEFPKMSRFSREVIVTEKIDGTNAQICIGENGEFMVGSRTRWITPEDDNHGFAKWAMEHKDELLKLGPGRHFGEWWGLGIQRNYTAPDKRFSLFNVERWGIAERPECCRVVPTLWRGPMDQLDIAAIMLELKANGSFAERGYMNPEGIVVFHTAANIGFKKTFEKDATGKGK